MSSTLLLSAILQEIGGLEHLKAFTSDDQDDACIPSYRRAEKVSRDYGLSPQMASNFVSMCRAALLVQKIQKLGGSSGAKNSMLSAIIEEIGASEHLQAFISDEQDDECIPSYKKAEKVSRDYGLSPQLASIFVSMCRSVVAIQRVIVPNGAHGTAAADAPRSAEVVVFRPQQRTSMSEHGGSEADSSTLHEQHLHQQQPNAGETARSHIRQPPATEAEESHSPSMRDRLAALTKIFRNAKSKLESRVKKTAKPASSSEGGTGTAASPAASPHIRRSAPDYSDLQITISSSVGGLPLSCSEYTVEMSISDFCVLLQQLITLPPLDRVTVACCHRLTPKIRQHVRLGSIIARLTLLNQKSVVVQVTHACL